MVFSKLVISYGRHVLQISTALSSRHSCIKQLHGSSFLKIQCTSQRLISMAIPKGVCGNWDLSKCTPAQIEADTDALIAELGHIVDSVGAVPLERACYENIGKPLEKLHCDFKTRGSVLDMPQHCVADKAVRDASCKAEEKMEEFDVSLNMRSDIFERLLVIQKRGLEGLGAEQRRFVEKLIIKGKRYGLHLSEDVQAQVKKLKTKESELSIKFSSNLNEDDTKLYFNKEDLAGLHDDLIKEFPVGEDGKLEVTIKYNHLFPVMKKCKVPATRKAMITAANQKCMSNNTLLLEELIRIRHQLAQLLGYPTHAAFMLSDRMAKTAEAVRDFLLDLQTKLRPLAQEERRVLLDLKKEECGELGLEFDGKIELWDVRYYMDMVERKKYAVDHTLLREYFPLERVLSGMFEIYQRLLSVTFNKLEGPAVWHQDVSMYGVTDTETKELLGYFFLDLHPRPGKYSHAAVFPLQPTCRPPAPTTAQRQVSVCGMLCNFSKPSEEKPALLEHSEVETLFHEFGHVMHNVCSRVDMAMFCGTSVARDFVEAPSQMLENWVWEKEPLALMSTHYKTGEPIPDEVLNKLSASRKANAGIVNMRQVALATFDQAIHSRESADTASLFAKLHEEITGFPTVPNTNMPASFGHLGGGYDAQYYGYLWSEVFSMDMFEAKFAGKVLDTEVGKQYRFLILERGNTIDAMDMLVEFLGRPPNNAAFLKSKGL
ncbi:Peptidase M3A/M3B catalytic domain [Trinorchestia longiramus]|nr:Peptidase M3A/M3B catalytic domain [Trinorchestia longiramus]